MCISYTIAFPTDSFWGQRKPDGNWTGVLGMLQRDEADMAISVNNPTSEAKDVAVETEIIVPIDLVIMAGRLSRHQSNIFGLIQIFSWESKNPSYQKVGRMIQMHKSERPPAALFSITSLHQVVRSEAVLIASPASMAGPASRACMNYTSGEYYVGSKPMFTFNSVFYLNKKMPPLTQRAINSSDPLLYPAEEQHKGQRGDTRARVNEREAERWAETAAEKSTMALYAREKQEIKRVGFLDNNRAAHYTSTPDAGCCALGYIEQNTQMWT
ncbi:hypothetical protein IscW_ISCW006488 [Ixodes scapularis]|uniref:Uncharacterized protein n=1 Tax=Ixodes scapularis TaxID=6945 RepID=B7PP08_IXOSC|nr:hypothetical protein IscW_ISCW006488 [Ixodes scapularis]|eukprot:XP_002435500.1 hypothetical protein IscW_ISCW006488 [Ixodes scapularis]